MERADAQKERDLQFVFLQARDMYSLSIHAYTADCSRKAPMPISPPCELDDQIALEVRKACVVDSYDDASWATYDGQVMAVLRSGKMAGNATVTFTAEGYEPVKLSIPVVSE